MSVGSFGNFGAKNTGRSFKTTCLMVCFTTHILKRSRSEVSVLGLSLLCSAPCAEVEAADVEAEAEAVKLIISKCPSGGTAYEGFTTDSPGCCVIQEVSFLAVPLLNLFRPKFHQLAIKMVTPNFNSESLVAGGSKPSQKLNLVLLLSFY